MQPAATSPGARRPPGPVLGLVVIPAVSGLIPWLLFNSSALLAAAFPLAGSVWLTAYWFSDRSRRLLPLIPFLAASVFWFTWAFIWPQLDNSGQWEATGNWYEQLSLADLALFVLLPFLGAGGGLVSLLLPRKTTLRPLPRPHGRVLVTALTVTGLALVVGVAIGGYWWTHAQVFPADGMTITGATGPLTDHTIGLTFPKTHGRTEMLTLRDVTPRFSVNTAHAQATFWVCRLSPGEDPIGTSRSPQDECAKLRPFEYGDHFRYGTAPGSDYLLVTLTPTTLGQVTLDGVQLEYSLGPEQFYRHDSQTVGPSVSYRFR